MRYVAAIPLVLLFALLDIILLLSIVGMLIVAGDGRFPLSYHFAARVWQL